MKVRQLVNYLILDFCRNVRYQSLIPTSNIHISFKVIKYWFLRDTIDALHTQHLPLPSYGRDTLSWFVLCICLGHAQINLHVHVLLPAFLIPYRQAIRILKWTLLHSKYVKGVFLYTEQWKSSILASWVL